MPGRLMVIFYLWFLLALSLTVAGTAGVLALIFFQDSDVHIRERVLAEVRLGRDMAEHLLRTVPDPEALRALLAPLAAEGRLAVEVIGDG